MGSVVNFDNLAQENKRVFNGFAETQLATKKDLFVVKEELREEIAETKDEITKVKLELAVLKWVAFSTFGLVAAIAVRQFFS